jgi:3-oxoacyl-[acyl-carrier protein] reductase
MKPLAGKISIVTGAGRGIGRAIALVLSGAGSRVALAARSESELRSVAEEIRGRDGEVLIVPTDVARDEELERLVSQTVKEWGTVDHLINNAGWGVKAPIVDARVEDWDRTFRVNLRAPMILTRLVLPLLIEKKSGAIVNIGSVAGKMGQADVSAYSASKFGLIGFTESLFEEAREYGVKVSVIVPGYVDTALIPPTRKMERSKMIRPEDVAQSVLFVLSSAPNSCPVEITVRPQRTPVK